MRTVAGGSSARRVAVGAAVLLVALGALGWARRTDDGDAMDRAGSVLLDAEPEGLLEPEAPPDAYRIDYRIESYGGDDPVVTSDRLWVRRPWDSRLEVYDTPEPSGQPDAVQVAGFGAFRAEGSASEAVVVAHPPGPPTSDVRIAAALRDALDDRRAELVEHRQVLGRPCAVVRTAVPLASGDLAPPHDGDHADSCIDAQGLLLEEVVVSEGRPLLRRVAIDVDVRPDLAGVSFDVGEQTLAVDEGGGFVGAVDEGSRLPGRFFEWTAPEGFRREGRYAVVPPQSENFTDPTRRGRRLTYVSDVFVDGPDVVVVDQGGTLGDVDPFKGLDGVPIALDLGQAVLSYGTLGPAVVVSLGDGDFVRARGTVAPDVLLEVLGSVREVPGGELRLVEATG